MTLHSNMYNNMSDPSRRILKSLLHTPLLGVSSSRAANDPGVFVSAEGNGAAVVLQRESHHDEQMVVAKEDLSGL